MAVTFVTRTIGGVSKSVFVVNANSTGEDDDLLLLEKDLMKADIAILKAIDATSGASFAAKLAAYTLPNGVKATKFFAKRLIVQSVLATRIQKSAARKQTAAKIVDLQNRVAALEAA